MCLLMCGGFLVPTSRLIIHALVTGVPEIAQSDQFSFLELPILIRLCCSTTALNQEKSQSVRIQPIQCTLFAICDQSNNKGPIAKWHKLFNI